MKLKRVEKIDKKISYDISVKGTNCFFANGLLVHNSNAGVSYNDIDGLYVQSRNNSYELDKGDSHMGFTFLVNTNKQLFLNIINLVKEEYNIDTINHTITIYGEWAGIGVQKNVAISQIKKSFYTFGCKVSKPNDPEFVSYWVDISHFRYNDTDTIWNIHEFKTYEIEIDFNKPEEYQNKLVEIVEEVENECPVAKHFGVSGIGEGVVFSCEYKGERLIFKAKGERHAGKSKIKTLRPVDEGKIKLINVVVDKITPIWRLNQFFNEITDNGKNIDRKFIGPYIKMVMKDILEEDSDIISDAGLEPKDIGGKVSAIVKSYFFEQEKL